MVCTSESAETALQMDWQSKSQAMQLHSACGLVMTADLWAWGSQTAACKCWSGPACAAYYTSGDPPPPPQTPSPNQQS